jgi:putative DNA primase/helicase
MLKILEEPEHAVFILCTTEPEKLIDTVWARCMRLELKPLTDDQIRQLLRDVLDKEGKKGFPKQATTIITERAKGCPREALMLLGQVIGMDGEEALAFLGAEPGVAQRPDTAPEQPLTLAEALFSPTKKLIMPWNDFNELDIPKREFIIRPWLKEGDIVLITGVPGVGKTYFALEIARTASQGEKGMDGLWDASEIVTPTLFVDGELPQSDLQERGELTGLAKGDNCTLLSKLRLESADVDFDLAEGQHRGLLTELIMRGNDRGPYKLVILDNLFSLFNLNMKDDISWGAVNSWMLRLRAKGVTVVLLHHPTKKKKEQFGTAVRTFNISTHLHLEAPENYAGENARFTINIHKKRDKGLNVAGKQFEFVDGDWIVGFAGGGEEIKMMVARALIEGKSQADIAKEIGKSKGRISQIKKQLLDEGLIKEKAEGGYESTAQEEELEEGDDLEQE